MLGEKTVAWPLLKIYVRVEIGMCDCLRNNDIYYGGLTAGNRSLQ